MGIQKKYFIRLLAALPVIVAVLVVMYMVKNRTGPMKKPLAESVRALRVIKVSSVDLVPKAMGYGVAEPGQIWRAVAEVKGTVVFVHPHLHPGALIPEKTVLIEMNPSEYELAAARFPTLSASGSAAKTKQADLQAKENYAAGFDAAWEIDIFGGVSRSIEAATADMHASMEAFRSIQVSMAAEIALNYVEVRSFQNRIRVAEANVEAQRKTLEVVTVRFDLQLTDSLAVEQAKVNFAGSRAKIPPLETGLKQAMNRLAVLTGEKPGALNNVLQDAAPVPTAPGEIAVGIPADLIRRRPDIRKAERELAAQSARVGVVTADLYPHFSFSGVLQFQAADASNLFSTMSRLLSIGPAFRWNIFNAGSVRSNIRVQNERQKQSLIGYERSILIALEEVENAMVAYARELDRREFLEQAAAASRKSANLAESLYKDGLKDFIHVLDAQRAQFASEDLLAVSNAQVTSNLIRLYKALGGGWNPTHSIVGND